MKFWTKWIVPALVALGLVASAHAQDRGTRDEAKAMVDAAVAHIKKVGATKAYQDFTTDKATWTKKDLYVMVYDSKAVVLAHGSNLKLVGKDMSGLKDANGVQVVPGLLDVAKKGGGWFDYDWPDPISKKAQPKSTYAKPLPDGDGFVGVGIYK